ncbi:hypothetical protein SDC9_118483 [bioreactor metagenome]|uniref:Uncharacterized protein n=1 Tax=bioreactor metagenome TaxID=1076179 RepID=A0A645C2D8_9ZZZZ
MEENAPGRCEGDIRRKAGQEIGGDGHGSSLRRNRSAEDGAGLVEKKMQTSHLMRRDG